MLAKCWSKHVFDININNRTVNFHPSVSKCWQGWVSRFVKTLQTQLENQYFPGLFICWLKINGLPCSCSEFWGTKTYLSAMLRLFVSLFFCKTNKKISDSAMAASSNMWICQFQYCEIWKCLSFCWAAKHAIFNHRTYTIFV